MRKKIQGRSILHKLRTTANHLRVWLLAISAALILIYGAIFLWPIVPSQSNLPDSPSFKVKIAPHSSLANIANQPHDQGLSIYAVPFQISAKALFVGARLKPGTYLLPTGASLGKVLLQIARGDRVRESIAIIPGMSIWQLRGLMDSHPALIHQTKDLSSKALLQI
jgi:UPF0755 protein